MNTFVLPLLMAPPPEGQNPLLSFMPLVAIIAIFYFLILRPQKKRQNEAQKMISSLKKGDRVVTAGGIHGVIQSVKDSTVIVKVDENVKLEFNRASISAVVGQGREDKEEKRASEEGTGEASGTDNQ